MNSKAPPLLSRFSLIILIAFSFFLVYFLRSPRPEITEIPQSNTPQAAKTADFTQGTYRVTRVLDGDTIELKDGTRVRYEAIDAPETNTSYSSASTEFNQELVGGKDVLVVPAERQRDSYGRLLAYVYVGDIFVNKAMVEAGYARLFVIKGLKKPEKYEELKAAEDYARSRHLGIWLDEWISEK